MKDFICLLDIFFPFFSLLIAVAKQLEILYFEILLAHW